MRMRRRWISHPHPSLPPSRGKGSGAPPIPPPTLTPGPSPRGRGEPSPRTHLSPPCDLTVTLDACLRWHDGMGLRGPCLRRNDGGYFTRMAQGLVRPCKRMKMGRRGLSLASVLGTPTFPERCFGSAQHDNRGGEVPASAGTTGQGAGTMGRYFHKECPRGLVRPRKGMKMGRRGLSLASVLGTPTFPERCFGSAQHDRQGGEVPASAGTTGQGGRNDGALFSQECPGASSGRVRG